MSANALLSTLVIPASGSDPTSPATLDTRGVDTLAISAPAALTGTITILAPDGSTLQSPPGTDVTIAASKTVVFMEWPFNSVTVHSSGTEASSRTFTVYGMRRQSGSA